MSDGPGVVIADPGGVHIAAVKDASTTAVAADKALVVAVSPNSDPATATNQATEIASLAVLDDVPTAMNAAFVKASPIAGQLDDAATTAALEDAVAPARITPQRALHTNLRNQAGTEVGTAAAPVRTDPTGTTTQPVSASSLPLPTGAATETTLGTRVADATITARLGPLGQAAMAASAPVTIASDQTRLPVATEAQLDYDSGGGVVNLSLVGLALPASGGPVAGGTNANPVRVDPTGTTTQPVSVASLPLPAGAATQATLVTLLTEADFDARVGNVSASPTANTILGRIKDLYDRFIAQLPAALIGGRLDTNNGAWLGSTDPTVGQKTMAASIPVVIPSDQTLAVTTAPSGAVTSFITGDVTTAARVEAAVRSTAYTEQTSNAQRSIVSTSASDSAAGTGLRTVLVTYMDATGAGPFTETLTMNGTTPVNFVNTNVCFIEDVRGVTAGSAGQAVGTINLKAAVGGGGVTIGSIAAGTKQVEWAHHYVPTGKTAHITSLWAGHTGTTVGSGCTMTIRTRPIGVANAIERRVSDKFRIYGQSSSVQRNYGSAILVVGPARLVAYVLPETSTSVNYRASFDLYEL